MVEQNCMAVRPNIFIIYFFIVSFLLYTESKIIRLQLFEISNQQLDCQLNILLLSIRLTKMSCPSPMHYCRYGELVKKVTEEVSRARQSLDRLLKPSFGSLSKKRRMDLLSIVWRI